MLNNSQDELLLAYTDFCKAVFPAGLPSNINGTLPKKFTNLDLEELKNFLMREDTLTELQYKLVIKANLDHADWEIITDRDSNKNSIRALPYEEVLPYIILGFQLYVTKDIDNHLGTIVTSDQLMSKNSQADKKENPQDDDAIP